MSRYLDTIRGLEDDTAEDDLQKVFIGQEKRVYLTADIRRHCIHVYDQSDDEVGIIERFDFPAVVEMAFRSSTQQQLRKYLKSINARIAGGEE